MKKLTAGIFATILGLTTVNAFAATAGTKVASTTYVDGAVAAANAYTDAEIAEIQSGITQDLTEYAKTAEVTSAINTAKSEAIADAANAAAGLYETKESAKAYETKANAAATYATKDDIKNMATSGQITDLGTRVGTIEGDYLKAADIADMATNTVVAATYATQTSVNDLAGDVNENAIAITNLQTADTTLQANIDKKLDSTAAAATYETIENAKAYAKTADLAPVATSGSYTDLTNVPTDLVTNAAIANMATKTDIANAVSGKLDTATYESEKTGFASAATVNTLVTEVEQVEKDVTALTTTVSGKLDTTTAANTYATKTSVTEMEGRLDAQEGAISTIRNDVELKANSADVYTKNVADTTFVKVSDIVDTYPATQAAQ